MPLTGDHARQRSTRNYRVTAVTDAMGAVHDHHHEACLGIWENKFARLKTTAAVEEEMVSASPSHGV